LTSLRVGGFELLDPIVTYSKREIGNGFAGLGVGQDIFSGNRVLIDIPQKTMYIAPTMDVHLKIGK